MVCIPAGKTLELLDDCAAKGVASVHFFSAGFRESGGEAGAALEKAMLDKARAGGFRIVGPNSTGLFVPGRRFIAADRMPAAPGAVAFISQSGGHAQDLPFHAGFRGVTYTAIAFHRLLQFSLPML
jgi:acyl-CoA synthetase (NDP forming)